MIPWIVVDTAPIPGDAGELRLLRRGTEFSIQLGHNELMNSRLSGSEKALAHLAAERIGARAGVRFLVGGLGMGFTLRAALDALKPDAAIVVAELVPNVAEWVRGPLSALSADALSDDRVELRIGDIVEAICSATSAYDAILLDVDNGPDGLTRPANDRLYDEAGLGAAMAALRPGGVLAVWSAHPDRHFTQRLRRAGFAVDEVPVRANGTSGARHTIWLAGKPGRPQR
ncbi:spermidine synthase [Methylobacterium marchantiae]|uniref:Spermidine synthase n=1 Tax=Methylobacterium marchantiae TaxID=600331 RepID=A0ABW3WSP2_9HYPH|nr:Polyamine aminopropyltransferase [Methylobacterium marchantiae]